MLRNEHMIVPPDFMGVCVCVCVWGCGGGGTIAALYPKKINYPEVDFSECRSEEVISLLFFHAQCIISADTMHITKILSFINL